MEKKRKSYIFPAIWQGIALGLVLGLVIVIFVGEIFITMIVSLSCCIYAMFMYRRSMLSDIYKKEIMPQLVATLGEGVKYTPAGGISCDSLKKCNLYATRHDYEYNAEDCVSGVIGKTAFTFSEAHLWYETKDSDNEKHSYTVFQGIGYEADFNKNFNGVTLLSSSRPGHLSKKDYPQVKLEDPAFNKKFSVYSTDEIEARYILSPALQERFMKLVESIHKGSGEDKIKISFYDSKILILMESNKDRFEAKILSRLDIERVKEDLEIIQCLGGIVEELNLNNRIWSKQ